MSDKTINELVELTDVSQTDELIIYDSSETEGNPTKKVKVENLLKNNYSTEEHPTGAKWIDGKPIYQKTVYVATTSANPIDISSMNIDIPIRVVSAVSLKYNNATERQVLPQLAGGIGGGISFQQNYLVVTKGIASYDYQDNYITLEYTKTTD